MAKALPAVVVSSAAAEEVGSSGTLEAAKDLQVLSREGSAVASRTRSAGDDAVPPHSAGGRSLSRFQSVLESTAEARDALAEGAVAGADAVAAQHDEAEPTEDLATSVAGCFPGSSDRPSELMPPPETENDLLASAEIKEEQYRKQIEQKPEQLKHLISDRSKFSPGYYENSKKESAVLEYIANFNRQYMQLYPGRKELFLCPENEFGVKKFVCSTIRPTQLPYKELYDFRGCAKFVADYFAYERLDPPHELPTHLYSPTLTLKLQAGNCFDFSVLLVSLLRGVGYDAYVVSGYALREITTMDETHTDLMYEESTGAVSTKHPASEPLEKRVGSHPGAAAGEECLNWDAKKQTEAMDGKAAKYKVKPPRMLRSTFLASQEAKKKAAEQAAAESLKAKEEKEKAASEEDEDELRGLRIHAWVLVLPGKREVAEAFFIEPTTSKIYPTDSDEYLGVESVFSSLNYWVNMQACEEGLKGVSFDLGDNAKWEFVLLDNSQPGLALPGPGNRVGNHQAFEEEEDEEDENGAPGTEVLDLPPSWVDKISLSKEQFESRCPQGFKQVTYKNARHEIFAEYHRPDGMVSRLTFFDDETRTSIREIKENFENRKDRLRQRIRLPRQRKIREFFDAGRPHGLKEHVIINGKTSELHFYPTARSDGLLRRVEEPLKVIEYFKEREDQITYRSVTYDKDGVEEEKTDHSLIAKMTEKFERDDVSQVRAASETPTSGDVAKRTFFLKDEKIRVIYHLDKDNIIASFREFKKPTADNKGTFSDFTNNFEVNPYAKPLKKQHLYAKLCALLKAEQACLQAIKSSDREMKDILAARVAEEKDINLVISVYDTIRNATNLPADAEAEAGKAEEEEAKAANLDYLSPFLVNVPDPNSMTREDALEVKDACLKALKERLISKANIIQARYEEQTTAYQKRQLQYSRNSESMTIEETEDYVNYCNDVLFRIHILEKRLQKHKESAPDKYVALDRKLRADPRLSVLAK